MNLPMARRSQLPPFRPPARRRSASRQLPPFRPPARSPKRRFIKASRNPRRLPRVTFLRKIQSLQPRLPNFARPWRHLNCPMTPGWVGGSRLHRHDGLFLFVATNRQCILHLATTCGAFALKQRTALWAPIILGSAIVRTRGLLLYRLWLGNCKQPPQKATHCVRFARYILDYIGDSGGRIGCRGWFRQSRVRCTAPAKEWAARQKSWALRMTPWRSSAEILSGLCHTAFGIPWYIQLGDRPEESLADWLNRELHG